MNNKPRLAIFVISAGLMLSTSSQAFDLYAETDATSPAIIAPQTPPTKPNSKTLKNKQENIRAKRAAEKKQRKEQRKARYRKERMERREDRGGEQRKEHRGVYREQHNYPKTTNTHEQ